MFQVNILRMSGEFMKCIHWLLGKQNKIGLRLTMVFLLVIYLPLLLNIGFIYTRTLQATKEERIEVTTQILEKTKQSIDLTMRDIQHVTSKMTTHLGLQKAVSEYDQQSPVSQINTFEWVARIFNDNKSIYTFIEQIWCITESGHSFHSLGDINVEAEEFLTSDLYKEFSRMERDAIWMFMSDKELFPQYKDRNLFFILHKIRNLDGEVSGYLFVFIDIGFFQSLYKEFAPGTSGEIVIHDNNYRPIISTPQYAIPSSMLHSFVSNDIVDKMRELRIHDTTYSIGIMPLKTIEWYIVSVVPIDELVMATKKALKSSFKPLVAISIVISVLLILEIMMISKLRSEREMAKYQLELSEEMNQKLRVYKHDFLNHLQIIQGLIQLKQPQRALGYLKKVAQEGRQIQSNFKIGIPELESTISTATALAEDHQIRVQVDSITLPAELPVDLYDLMKILTNLIKNAMYALIHADAAEKKLIIRIYKEKSDYVFEVVNNVPLIPVDDRNLIFKKGYTTKGKDGDGLGLYIVKTLALQNDGDVELQVDLEGNHFIVRFPEKKDLRFTKSS